MGAALATVNCDLSGGWDGTAVVGLICLNDDEDGIAVDAGAGAAAEAFRFATRPLM